MSKDSNVLLNIVASLIAAFFAVSVLARTVSVTIQFSKTLLRGSSGDEVKRLQEFLKTTPEVYPEGLVTGYFGALTEKAVKRFQTKYGIESIGIVGPKTRSKLNELTRGNIYENSIYGFRFSYPADFKIRELTKEEREPAAEIAYRLEPKISAKDSSAINFSILQVQFETKVKEVNKRYEEQARSGSTWGMVRVWNIIEAQEFVIRRDYGNKTGFLLIPRKKGGETYFFQILDTTNDGLKKGLEALRSIAETFEFLTPANSEWPSVNAKYQQFGALISFRYPPDWRLATSEGVEGPVGITHPFFNLYVAKKPNVAIDVEMYVSAEPRNFNDYQTWENQVRGIRIGGYSDGSITYEPKIVAGYQTLYYSYLAHDVSPVHTVLFPTPDEKFIIRASLHAGNQKEVDQFWGAFEDFIKSITVTSLP